MTEILHFSPGSFIHSNPIRNVERMDKATQMDVGTAVILGEGLCRKVFPFGAGIMSSRHSLGPFSTSMFDYSGPKRSIKDSSGQSQPLPFDTMRRQLVR